MLIKFVFKRTRSNSRKSILAFIEASLCNKMLCKFSILSKLVFGILNVLILKSITLIASLTIVNFISSKLFDTTGPS
jgi:putative flippase GtrA